jgi:hypothetical protein
MEKNILVSVHDEASARYSRKKGRREMRNTHVADVCGFVVGDGYVVESGVGRSEKKHKKICGPEAVGTEAHRKRAS